MITVERSRVERSRLEWGGLVLSVVLVVGIVSIAVGSLTHDRAEVMSPGTSRADTPRGVPLLADRLAAVDHALANKDVSTAIYAWRDAHSLALGARRADAMADVGDAAVRIDAIVATPPGHVLGFRAEARQAYLRALFLARRQRSQDVVDRIAKAFAGLGDTEMAARVQAITVTP